MNIFLIRHGLTPLNKLKKVNGRIDEQLDPEGIEQARQAIVTIPKSVKQIYSSPMLRAKQTASIIGTALNLPIVYNEAIAEIDFGTLVGNGKAWEEMENGLALKEKHRSLTFDYRAHGGESAEDVKKRLVPFLQSLAQNHKDNEVLVVTHGGIVRTIRFLENNKLVYDSVANATLVSVNLDL